MFITWCHGSPCLAPPQELGDTEACHLSGTFPGAQVPASSSLTPLSIVLQAMRFPPKSYNKDLESAEVSCFLLWVEAGVSGKPGRVRLGADQLSAWLVLSSLGGSGWVQTTRPRLVLSPPPLALFPRSGENGSSRTWSLPRRWQKMMTTASLELRGWGGVGRVGTGSVFPPWGSPAQGTGSSSHMGHTDCYVQGVRGAGSRSPYLIPGPLLSR